MHEGEYAKVGTVAEVGERVRLPGGGRAVTLAGLHRGIAGAAHTDPDGRLRVEVEERPDEEPPRVKTRELEREYRAVVEEILELRGADGRISRVRPLDHASPARSPTRVAYAPDLTLRAEGRAARGRRRRRAPRARPPAPARAARRAAGAPAHPRGRRVGRAEAAARVLPAQASSSRSARSSARTTASVAEDYRTKIAEAGMPDDVREQAERELARLERMGDASGESSMIRTYLDWLLAVPWGKRSEERLDPVHAREVLDADHAGLEDVKDRIVEYLAVRKLRAGARHRRGQALRRDPHPDRPARDRQDLDRRVDRPRAQPRVRPHVARRRPRRGRDPRPPPHVHRRAAGPARARAARRRDDEPGDPARRGRQGRRRLARRPVGGAARGARPGAEPLVPRPLPRRRARPLRGRLHRDGERRRHDPRPAARPDGGHPLRRLHGRREGRDRPRLPLAAPARAQRPARGRGRRSPTTLLETDRLRVHARGGRPPARARARQAAAQDGDAASPPARTRAAGRRRRGRRPRRARPAALLPGGRRADRRARRRDRPRRHRNRRRRPVRRGDAHEGRRRRSSSPASSAT